MKPREHLKGKQSSQKKYRRKASQLATRNSSSQQTHNLESKNMSKLGFTQESGLYESFRSSVYFTAFTGKRINVFTWADEENQSMESQQVFIERVLA